MCISNVRRTRTPQLSEGTGSQEHDIAITPVLKTIDLLKMIEVENVSTSVTRLPSNPFIHITPHIACTDSCDGVWYELLILSRPPGAQSIPSPNIRHW